MKLDREERRGRRVRVYLSCRDWRRGERGDRRRRGHSRRGSQGNGRLHQVRDLPGSPPGHALRVRSAASGGCHARGVIVTLRNDLTVGGYGDGMRGDDRVIEFLNEQLTAELTAINQYFLHAKMQENFGWIKIARHTRAESIDEMRHAETLTDRILYLDALPNYQRLFALRVGETIGQMLEADLAVETEAVDRLRRGIEYMRGIGDVTSANIFEDILADEEQHIDYLETQIGLVSQLGEQLYLAQLVEQPDS
jgi:bacterioferritin